MARRIIIVCWFVLVLATTTLPYSSAAPNLFISDEQLFKKLDHDERAANKAAIRLKKRYNTATRKKIYLELSVMSAKATQYMKATYGMGAGLHTVPIGQIKDIVATEYHLRQEIQYRIKHKYHLTDAEVNALSKEGDVHHWDAH